MKAALMGGDREGLGDQGFACQSVEGGEFGTNLLSTRQSTTIPLDAFTYTILTKVQQKVSKKILNGAFLVAIELPLASNCNPLKTCIWLHFFASIDAYLL